jgi:redox-sensitive bicupin YhaK (pirin superfamily)
LYLDISLPAGASFEQSLPASHNAFVYVYRGEVDIGATHVCGILYSAFPKYFEPPTAAGISGSVEVLRRVGEKAAQHGITIGLNTQDDHRGGAGLPVRQVRRLSGL